MFFFSRAVLRNPTWTDWWTTGREHPRKMDAFCEEREEWCEERLFVTTSSFAQMTKVQVRKAPHQTCHVLCISLQPNSPFPPLLCSISIKASFTLHRRTALAFFVCVCVLIWSEQERGLISWSGRVLLGVIVSWKWQKRNGGGAMFSFLSFFSFLYDHKREVLL